MTRLIERISVAFFFFLTLSLCAQENALTLKKHTIAPNKDTLLCENTMIDLQSIALIDQPSSLLIITPVASNANCVRLRYIGDEDNVTIHYRVISEYITRKQSTYQTSMIDTLYLRGTNVRRYDELKPIKREELFETEGISKNGVLSRGLAVSNTQGVLVNSALNLQLEGQLSPDLKLNAVISDQNVPFQPEGNTQNIQEFDKVYIELEAAKSKLVAGDVVIEETDDHYLRYRRNVQGLYGEKQWASDSGFAGNTAVGAALSKGKFASTQLQQLEGVQGPYKLRGPNAERFIIILSNSEKVYIDGKLMTRGWNYDYIIDYNLAEITFTSRVMITQFTRIRVDFEYADRNYSRATYGAKHEQALGKNLTVGFNYYQERDNPNNPLAIQLGQDDINRLALIGDQTDQAFVSGFDDVGFDSNEPRYKIDSTGANPRFMYSTNADSAIYKVIFTDVGEGNGEYRRLAENRNQPIYQWVGAGQGRYMPFRLIPTPKKKQMATFNAAYTVKEKHHFSGEYALSEEDKNLFSRLDSEDNKGKAGILAYKGKDILSVNEYKLNIAASYEWNDSLFTEIDRFRYIEFDRDWSADPLKRGNNRLFSSEIALQKSNKQFWRYKYLQRNKTDDVAGSQYIAEMREQYKQVYISANYFKMNNNKLNYNSNWQRLQTELGYERFVTVGARYNFDHQYDQDIASENINRTMMYFDEIGVFMRTADTTNIRFKADYIYREDKDTANAQLQLYSVSHNISSTIDWDINTDHHLGIQAIYRELNYTNDQLSAENNLMGRFDWNSYFFKRNIHSEFNVATATSRELRREFIFIEVPIGQGTHVYRDFNNNGIQELDEFVIDPLIGNYIKAFVPTDDYINAFNTVFNYKLTIKTPIKWRQTNGIKGFLGRFSSIAAWNYDMRQTDNDLLTRLVPLRAERLGDNLLGVKESLRSTLFFNRSHTRYGFDLNYFATRNKQLLMAGFDSLGTEGITFNSRWNLSKRFSIQNAITDQVKKSASDILLNNNFNVHTGGVEPVVYYQPNNDRRLAVRFAYREKINRDELRQFATFQEWGTEYRFSKVAKYVINTSIRMIHINHNQNDLFAATPVGFEMLEAYQKGVNWNWQISFQKKLINGLQVNIIYEARKPNQQQIAHMGRAEVSALF